MCVLTQHACLLAVLRHVSYLLTLAPMLARSRQKERQALSGPGEFSTFYERLADINKSYKSVWRRANFFIHSYRDRT